MTNKRYEVEMYVDNGVSDTKHPEKSVVFVNQAFDTLRECVAFMLGYPDLIDSFEIYEWNRRKLS